MQYSRSNCPTGDAHCARRATSYQHAQRASRPILYEARETHRSFRARWSEDKFDMTTHGELSADSPISNHRTNPEQDQMFFLFYPTTILWENVDTTRRTESSQTVLYPSFGRGSFRLPAKRVRGQTWQQTCIYVNRQLWFFNAQYTGGHGLLGLYIRLGHIAYRSHKRPHRESFMEIL